MKATSWIIAGLGCALCAGVVVNMGAQQGYGPPPQGQNYGPPPQGPGGWDAPPQEYTPTRQQGFRDGIRAAREDFRSGRGFAVTRNPMYRHPPTPRFQRDEYRDGFQRGYDRVMRHRGDGPPPPPPGQYYPH